MPLFSILVSELTPGLLSKAEWWKFYSIVGDLWADTRPSKSIVTPESEGYPAISLSTHYYDSVCRCFPVTLSPDGTETRLECPRMPDEPLIAEWSDTTETTATLRGMTSTVDDRLRWRLEVSGIPLTYWTLPPTPEHYPRRTCDGVWVWSTRR